MEHAAENAGLAHLLAEAAAGVPGAECRVAASLRPDLEALLKQRLADPGAALMADAGALVQRHWQQWRQAEASAGTGDADGAASGDPKSATGKRGKAARKTTAKPRKGAKGAKVVGETTAPNLLFLPYVEQAAVVMEGLVRDLAVRTGPGGPALTTLNALRALDALAELDPALAHTARLRWFAGMEHGAIAGLLNEGEPEVRRRWVKARAFVIAATKGFALQSP
jgi:hypothetical protein